MANRLPLTPPVIPGHSYLHPLGSGGFADVFLYQQSMPSREVAVKVFLNTMQSNSALAVSFKNEANNLAKLSNHPNIVPIFDASVSSNGHPYIAMAYCPTSLGKNWRTNPLPLEQVLDVGVQVASALETVHRSGLLHRDIKPSNILLNTFNVPVLSDFGIAGNLAPQAGEQVAMSLPWSAPEVVSLQTAGTKASEVWSLGATLYSLLAGRTPFETDNPAQNTNEKLKSRILQAIYTPIPRGGIPRAVEEVLNKAMSKDPRNRYSTMYELALHINEIQATLGFNVTRIIVGGEAPKPPNPVDSYPCGHPKPDLPPKSIIETKKRRGGVKVDEVDLSVCPICSAKPVINKPKKKLPPIFWMIIAALGLGFAVTAGVLMFTGGF